MKNFRQIGITLLLLSLVTSSCFQKKSYSYISEPAKSKADKEAILILPGFGSIVHGNKKQLDFFSNKGYDIYIPKYIKRKSIQACVEALDEYVKKNKLNEYKKVHVFSYIVGSWVLNTYLKDHKLDNIASILYDRSPLQERAPYALIKDSPVLARLIGGKIMWDFKNTPYPTLPNNSINKGILIESKATDLIRKHKKTALSMGELNWDVKNLNQSYSDFYYIRLNHDEMYFKLDVIGNELFHFIKNRQFTTEAQRVPYNWDYFSPYQD